MIGDLAALDRTISTLTTRLLDRRTPSGHWEGFLSSSALSTALATVALMLDTRVAGCHRALTDAGFGWLIRNQNEDGGWGDTVMSASNLSTTVLCWAALSFRSRQQSVEPEQHAMSRAEEWLTRHVGNLRPQSLRTAILAAYGKDRTFSAPILTVLALTGTLGSGTDAWRHVPQLPFELAACPHRCFEWLRLPVVSYALPALVAIGEVRHHHRPTRNILLAPIRSALRSRTRRIAGSMQPASGGYLEATPLTAFVVASLIGSGNAQDPIVDRGICFLTRSVRPDGSWPIDTNLATWLTTLSVAALNTGALTDPERTHLVEWLLQQQVHHEHPFTHAKPGAWAWTDLPGGVPDADDTAGALIALRMLAGEANVSAATRGIQWLLNLQNRDGGIPTFCRGWGALPFDRSAPDLTAHAVEAWSAWFEVMPREMQATLSAASGHALSYLARSQNSDGSWVPLWFGNEQTAGQINATYGTARVVVALCAPLVRDRQSASTTRQLGVRWLLRNQNSDGGWGAGGTRSSIEETGAALHALGSAKCSDTTDAVMRGSGWLISATEEGKTTPPTPIGLYFARLWYYEELYPVIFALRGLAATRDALRAASQMRTSA